MVDIEHLVEEFAHVEAKTLHLFFAESFRILGIQNPAFVGGAVFQLVTVSDGLFRADNRLKLRHLQMPDAGQLVIDLPLFCAKLDFIGERLPPAAAANAEMAAEWLQTVL